MRCESGDGHTINGTLLDVRTALPADEVKSRAMLDQGDAATHAVITWMKERPDKREASKPPKPSRICRAGMIHPTSGQPVSSNERARQ
jgi:hypothetical protein